MVVKKLQKSIAKLLVEILIAQRNHNEKSANSFLAKSG